MEGMDIKLADLKNSCDYKVLSLREQCEGQEENYLSLAELMDSKEADLRAEIQDLKTELIGRGKEGARESVLARVENLEVRLNWSEKVAASRVPSVEEKLRAQWAQTLEDRLTSMEDRLTSLLVEANTDSPSSGQPQSQDALTRDFNSLKGSVEILEGRFDELDQRCSEKGETDWTSDDGVQQDIQSLRAQMNGQILNYSKSIQTANGELRQLRGRLGRLEDSLSNEVRQNLNSSGDPVGTGAQHHELRTRLEQLGEEVKAAAHRCREQTEDAGKEVARMEGRVVRVESLCGRLEPISSSIQRIEEGLQEHVSSLWTHANQLNGTVSAHAREIGGLTGTCEKLQEVVANLTGDLLVPSPSNPGKKGKLQYIIVQALTVLYWR